MRAAAPMAFVFLVAACAGAPAATPAPASTTPAATVAPATPPPASPTPQPTPAAAATIGPDSTFTAEDEEIAKLVKAGADEAIPKLALLPDMDVSQLTDALLDVRAWVNAQKMGVAAFSPGVCTAGAVALFTKGMDRYSDIAEEFLAWREWGAVGHPYPLGAPAQAVASLEDAVLELEACSA
jgi:hypothetical protein